MSQAVEIETDRGPDLFRSTASESYAVSHFQNYSITILLHVIGRNLYRTSVSYDEFKIDRDPELLRRNPTFDFAQAAFPPTLFPFASLCSKGNLLLF